MQGQHANKMPLGFAFALLLTLQIFQLVSSQTSDPWNELLTNYPLNGIPEEWKRGKYLNSPEEEVGVSSGSMIYSGDDEYQAANQTVTAVTEQYDDNTNTTSSPQTTHTVSSNPTQNTTTFIQQNNTSNPVTPNPYTGPSTTSDNHVNITETNTTTQSPEYSTAPSATTIQATTATSAADFNFTQTSTANFTTTSSQQPGNYTNAPSVNSTNPPVITTTTMLNHTSVVLTNEPSTVPTTNNNGTGGSFDARGIVDRGLSSDIQQQSKSQAWGAILGIGVGVAIVALVIYVIVKRKNYREFSHRKLVEDMPPETVLRLDNSEPLDLKFDGFAYYNPGLQGDNIQMTNFPQGHAK